MLEVEAMTPMPVREGNYKQPPASDGRKLGVRFQAEHDGRDWDATGVPPAQLQTSYVPNRMPVKIGVRS